MVKRKFEEVTRQKWFAYAMITLAAFLYTFGTQSIMQVAQVLPSGLGSLAVVAIFIEDDLNPYFGLMYLALNAPLILLFTTKFKVKRKFMRRTIYFLVISTILSFLTQIDAIKDVLLDLLVDSGTKDLDEYAAEEVWPMLVLPVLGAAIVGLAVATCWKFGGSTGGTDIVVYYLSTKKKMQIGNTSMIVSIFIMSISFTIMITLNDEIRGSWLPSLAGSFTYVFISSLLINIIFPKYSKVMVEIHSAHIPEITTELKKGFPHAFRIAKATSGYTGNEIYYINTAMLLLEVRSFKRRVLAVDPNAWISSTKTTVSGNFNTSSVDDD